MNDSQVNTFLPYSWCPCACSSCTSLLHHKPYPKGTPRRTHERVHPQIYSLPHLTDSFRSSPSDPVTIWSAHWTHLTKRIHSVPLWHWKCCSIIWVIWSSSINSPSSLESTRWKVQVTLKAASIDTLNWFNWIQFNANWCKLSSFLIRLLPLCQQVSPVKWSPYFIVSVSTHWYKGHAANLAGLTKAFSKSTMDEQNIHVSVSLNFSLLPLLSVCVCLYLTDDPLLSPSCVRRFVSLLRRR